MRKASLLTRIRQGYSQRHCAQRLISFHYGTTAAVKLWKAHVITLIPTPSEKPTRSCYFCLHEALNIPLGNHCSTCFEI
jgi:hypothetical protein